MPKTRSDGVPCTHVITVLAHKHWNTNDFVSDYYSAESLYRTWEQTLEPFGTVDAYPQLNVPKYVPDKRKILRGRRKHHRMPMTMDEMGREGKKKHSYRCTRCGGQGHTKRTCRVPYEQAEGSRRRHSTSGPPSNAHMLNEFLPGKSLIYKDYDTVYYLTYDNVFFYFFPEQMIPLLAKDFRRSGIRSAV